MLLRQNPRRQIVRRVVRQNFHRALPNHRTRVHLLVNPMHRASVRRRPGFNCATMRVQSGKVRQQRRMNVHQPPPKAGNKRRAEHSHKPRQRHDFRRPRLRRVRQLFLKRDAVGEVRRVNAFGENPRRAGDCQRRRLRPVAENGGHFAAQSGALQNRAQVAAATGSQNNNAAFH